MQIQLWEKVLEGGSLSNTAELAASATTDASGAYRMTFERRNASEYEVRYGGSGLVDGSVFINPESVVPGTPRCVNLSIPEATTVVVGLVNSNPKPSKTKSPSALKATSPVCAVQREVVLTDTPDSTRTCIEHAGKWLRYFATVERISGTYTPDWRICCSKTRATYGVLMQHHLPITKTARYFTSQAPGAHIKQVWVVVTATANSPSFSCGSSTLFAEEVPWRPQKACTAITAKATAAG